MVSCLTISCLVMKLINIPNLITCGNLLCGCLAIVNGLQGNVGMCCLLIILGAVFDFFDGMTARALHISGPIGKELDSLADCVTFGVAPSVLCYHICLNIYIMSEAVSLLAFVMAAFSALRLAKFNCDERQTTSFIGLPTPANALFWIGFTYMCMMPSIGAILNGWVVLALMVVMSYLLICELPMFSLKLKPGHNGFHENWARYVFLALVVIMAIVFALLGEFKALPAAIILLYVIMSVVNNTVKK